MMRFGIFLVFVLIQLVSGQLVLRKADGLQTVTPGAGITAEVGTTTTLYASYAITLTETKTFTVTSSTADVTFTPSTFTLSPANPTATLTWTTTTSGTAGQISIEENPGASTLVYPVTINKKSFKLDQGSSTSYLSEQPLTVYKDSQQNVLSISSPLAAGSSVTLTPSGGSVQFTPSSFVFDSTHSSVPFTYKATTVDSQTVTWTISGDNDNQFGTAASTLTHVVTSTKKVISVFPNPAPSATVGQTSAQISVSLADAVPTGSITVTPSTPDPAVTFSPASLTFTGATLSQSFSFTSSKVISAQVALLVTGDAAGLYQAPANITISASTNKATLSGAILNGNTLLLLSPSDPITVTLSKPSINGVSVRIIASDPKVTFGNNGNLLTFGAGQTTASFTLSTQTTDPVTLSYSLEGADASLYTLDNTAPYTTVQGRQVRITLGSFATTQLFCGESFTSSITVEKNLEASAIQVALTSTAPGVSFPVGSSLSFPNSQAASTQPFTVLGSAVASGVVQFSLTGSNLDRYTSIADQAVTFNARSLAIPSFNAIKAGSFAQQTITLSRPTANFLTVLLSGTGIKFGTSGSSLQDTQNITFAQGQKSASFSMTVVNSGAYTLSINVQPGGDASCFSAPLYTYPFNAGALTLVTSVSSVNNVPFGQSSAPISLYIDGLSADVTVTPYVEPASALLTFTPSTVTLTKEKPSGVFYVKSVDLSNTAFNIKYAIVSNTPGFDASVVSTATVTPLSFTPIPFVNNPFAGLNQVVYAGVPSTQQSMVLQYPIQSAATATVTLSAPGVTFTPATFQFSAGSPSYQPFTFVADAGDRSQPFTDRTVSITVSGSSEVAPVADGNIRVYLRPLDVMAISSTPIFIGQQFYFTVVASIPPTGSLQLQASPNGVNTPFTFTSATQTIDATTSAVTFTGVATDYVGTSITISVSGTDAQYYSKLAITNINIPVQRPSINLNLANLLSAGLTLLVGETGYGTITLDALPTDDMVVTVSNTQLTVSPSTFTFGPSNKELSRVFSVTPKLNQPVLASTFVTSNFIIGASGANNVANKFLIPYVTSFTFAASTSGLLRGVSLSSPSGSTSLTLGLGGSAVLNLQISDPSDNGVVFTPVVQGHPEITFSPASVTLQGAATTAAFVVQSTGTYQPLVAGTPFSGYFEVSGKDAYVFATKASFSALQFTVQYQRTSVSFANGQIVSTTAGVPVAIDIGRLSALPANNINIYPVVITGPQLTFTPAFFSYTPSVQTTRVLALGQSVGTSQIAFVVNGTDANWIATPIAQYTVTVNKKNLQVSAPTAAKPGDAQILRFTVDVPPTAGLTITPVCSVCTFSPSSVTFSPTSAQALSLSVTINTAATTTATINYIVTGADAATYGSLPTSTVSITARTITLTLPSATPSAGATQPATIVLDAPAVHGVTVDLIAPGYTITPSSFNFAAGEVQKSFSYQVAAGSNTNGVTSPIQMALSGADAGWYTTSTPSLQNQQVSISATTSGAPASNGLTAYFRINTGIFGTNLVDTVVVTPAAQAGITFSPASVTLGPGQTDALVAATLDAASYATLANQAITVTFTQTGAGYTNPVIAPVTITFPGLSVNVAGGIGAIPIGVKSAPQTVTISGLGSTTQLGQAVTIKLYSSAGATVSPAELTITPPSYTASFTVTPTQVGTATIYYSVTSNTALFPTTYGTMLTYTAVLRTFDFGTAFTADFANVQPAQATDVFVYGQTTKTYAVFTPSSSDVSITPVSDFFTFNPAKLTFSPTTNSANFSMKATKIGRGLITWNIEGADAAYFNRPAPVSLAVTYDVKIDAIPAVKVGETSKNIAITISPQPVSQVYVTFPLVTPLSGLAHAVFNPPRVVFTPTSQKSTFTVTGRIPSVISSSIVYASSGANVLPAYPLVLGAGGTLQIRHADEGTSISLPLAHPVPISVKPGQIKVKHPRYQLDVTSHVQFEVDPAPVSDVTVALWGNNLFFDPPFATFTPNNTKVKVKATPRQTISYEIDNTPFKVEYSCSGSNQLHYICPTESLHYFAMPRGYVAAIVLVPLFGIILIVLAVMFLRGGSKRMVN